MKKLLVLAGVALTGLAVLAVSVFVFGFLTVGSMLGMAAAQERNPCVSPIGPLPITDDETRIPVAGTYSVTSEYGMRKNPVTGEYRLHAGTDLVVWPADGPVVAARAGAVSKVDSSTGGGNFVEIDHGGGLVTRYLHLSAQEVEVGDAVWAGKLIGRQGSTGNSTGPHLHFEVLQSGQSTDPRPWLEEQGVDLAPTGATEKAPPVVTENPGPVQPVPGPAPVNPEDPPGGTNPVMPDLPEKVGPYEGEQVLNAGYVIKAGQDMDLDAHSITIGVMTAMGESSLINLDHGDEAGPDSRGLFQQRDNGAWGSYEDRMNPTIASTNFYKALIKVPDYLDLEPTIAAHKTQGNADPYHYRPHWPMAVEMVSVLTEDPDLLDRLPVNGPVEGCEPGPGEPPPEGDGSGEAIVAAATHYIGTPYSWGGGDITGPTLGTYTSPGLDGTNIVGFDCSGLVLYAVYNSTGLQLPRGAEDQGHDPRGEVIPRDWDQMLPGDIIAFSQDGSGAPGTFGHIGIYMGDGQMVHAPKPGGHVEVVDLAGSAYYDNMYWSIRRFSN